MRTKKPFMSYVLPLSLSLGVIVLLVLLINVLLSYFTVTDQQNKLSQSLAEFKVTTPNVYLILNNKPSKLNEGWSNLTLSHQEGIMTGSSGKVELQVDHDQILRLDEFTSVFGSWNKGKKYFGVEKGNMWYEGDGNVTPQLLIKTSFLEIDPVDKAAVLVSMKDGMQQVAVFSGTAEVTSFDKDGKELDHKSLQSGEQIDVALTAGVPDSTSLKIIPSTLYDMSWVQENRKLAGVVQTNINDASENTNSTHLTNTNESELLSENMNANTKVKPDEEKKNLSKPTLSTTLPKDTTSFPSQIEGRISKDVVKVQVNDFVLQKFVAGSGVWKYQLIDGYNMKPGQNTFTVIGYAEDGTATPALVVKVSYTKENTASTTNENSNTNAKAAPTVKKTGTGTAVVKDTE